jgi:hypothetical protein
VADSAELLAYDDAPPAMPFRERLVAAALVGPWLACSTGWALVVAAHDTWRWIRR